MKKYISRDLFYLFNQFKPHQSLDPIWSVFLQNFVTTYKYYKQIIIG